MTSKQWAEVSKAFDTPPGERTERQQRMTTFGLCWAYQFVNKSGGAKLCLALRRFADFDVYMEPLPGDPGGATLRASLAALFAAMTAAERREVLGDF